MARRSSPLRSAESEERVNPSPADTQTDQRSLVGVPLPFTIDDEVFRDPFIDVDEDRALPVPHRYVHGGFRDTDTYFSLYLPSAENYEGRFFQHVTPFPQSEHLGPTIPVEYNKIVFAHASGAAFLETNGGGAASADPTSGIDRTISAFRANAAAAQFSRAIAREIYGEHRAFGYLYGGSGGGYRSIGSAENTVGVWDGFVPHVIGSSVAIPNVFSVRMHALRILRHRLADIADAFDAGGDPASLDLTEEERAAFDEVTRMGFPLRSWFGWKTMDLHGFSALYPGVIAADPTYTTEFWQLDGYLGADPEASIHRDRVRLNTTVVEFIAEEPADAVEVSGGVDESFKGAERQPARTRAIRLADRPQGWIMGAELRIVSGDAAGQVVRLSGVDGELAILEGWQGGVPDGLVPGDDVILDNSSFLAVQTYHRHQVPGPEFTVWDQFRDARGEPLFPQRSLLLGPLMSSGATGTEITGDITGKVIVVEALLDREAFPWQADWYRDLVRSRIGEEAADNQLRVWFIDNALHGDVGPQEFPGHTVSYIGALDTALRQLVAWVERGIEPSPTTSYEVVDGQVIVAEAAAERGGVQPVVTVTVNGGVRTDVRVGGSVRVKIVAEAVEGLIVDVVELMAGEDGTSVDEQVLSIEPAPRVAVERDVTFHEPGTYFVSARIAAQTAGDASSPHARVQNIARSRVVVHG